MGNTAENNLITTDVLSDAQVREIEFVEKFGESLKKLTELLGISRMIPKQAGTILKVYKATGTLEDGEVDEGEIIPLSRYEIEATPIGEMSLKKWRKATSAEAIIEKGYDQAVTKTTDRMLKDVQKKVRGDFFTVLATGTATAKGLGFQAAVAQAWGQLQVKFEDDEIESVYFLNPLDVADYIAATQITTQTAFGLSYIENFLGMGLAFLNTGVPKGKVYATAKENLVVYYIPTNGADLGEVFQFTSEETGLIAIHESPDYDNMTAKDVVCAGIKIFPERIDGVIVSTIEALTASDDNEE